MKIIRSGLALCLASAMSAGSAKAAADLVLHVFGQGKDGANPLGSLIKVNGLFYGTTSAGGKFGKGTVFSMTPQGVEHVIYNFGSVANDGSAPASGLLDINGTFFGTTGAGGTYGSGTLYSITPQGTEKAVYSFGASGDGTVPNGDLVYTNGVFYGTTQQGGAQTLGTVFAVSPDGKEAILHSFAGGPGDGASPQSGLMLDGGSLLGTTYAGGAQNLGTVYAVTNLAAPIVQTLYAFQGGADGASPIGKLTLMDSQIYGTTTKGGQVGAASYGTIFTLSGANPTQESVVYRFASDGASAGIAPGSALIGFNGVLYGTTSNGGPAQDGSLFSVSPQGVATILHGTLGGIDGAGTPSALKFGGAALYGVRSGGGAGGEGVAYRLISPFIKPLPVIAAVSIAKDGASYTATIKGRGFGASPVALPCANCNIPELYVTLIRASGGSLPTVTQWDDTAVVMTGLTGAAGQAYAFAVRNDALGTTASGFAALPGGPAAPVIDSVTVSAIGQDLHITVTGEGFGSAPAGVPGASDITEFEFIDWVTGASAGGPNYPWAAGHPYDTVALKYTFWSNTKIEIAGFGAGYGYLDWTVNPGDAALIYVQVGGMAGKAFSIQ